VFIRGTVTGAADGGFVALFAARLLRSFGTVLGVWLVLSVYLGDMIKDERGGGGRRDQ
jgi:hypothetical protein